MRLWLCVLKYFAYMVPHAMFKGDMFLYACTDVQIHTNVLLQMLQGWSQVQQRSCG